MRIGELLGSQEAGGSIRQRSDLFLVKIFLQSIEQFRGRL
jgi:hypothetical protein